MSEMPNFDDAMPAETPAAPAKKRWGRLDAYWLFLLALSGFATFEGLATHVGAGGVAMTWFTAGFCAVVVALLTTAMGVTADFAFGARKHECTAGGRIGSALTYLCCAFLSLLFAFAWWWGMLGAREATNAEVDRDIARVEAGLGDTRRQLASAKDRLEALRDISAERARNEAQSGGTCGLRGEGVGVVARMRDSHSHLFGQIADDAGRRIATLDQSIRDTQDKVSPLRKEALAASEEIRIAKLTEVKMLLGKAAADASALANDAGLRAYSQRLNALAQDYAPAGSHIGDDSSRFSCVDAGIESALKGAHDALTTIEAAPAPAFAIYEGNQATNEAMRRFVATLFGWAIGDALGSGIGEWNEFLALALSLIVDGLLLYVTLQRADTGGGDARQQRAGAIIARRHDRRAAVQLLTTDMAIAHAITMAALADPEQLPFADLIVEMDGRTYLVVPAIAPCVTLGGQAREMIRIAGQLDRTRSSGVREQIRFARRRFGFLRNRDRKARATLIAQGAGSARWAQGSHFRWFALTSNGLHQLAAWAQAHRAGTAKQDNIDVEPMNSIWKKTARSATVDGY